MILFFLGFFYILVCNKNREAPESEDAKHGEEAAPVEEKPPGILPVPLNRGVKRKAATERNEGPKEPNAVLANLQAALRREQNKNSRLGSRLRDYFLRFDPTQYVQLIDAYRANYSGTHKRGADFFRPKTSEDHPYNVFNIFHMDAALEMAIASGASDEVYHAAAYVDDTGQLTLPHLQHTWLVDPQSFKHFHLANVRMPHDTEASKPFSELAPNGEIIRYEQSFERLGTFVEQSLKKLIEASEKEAQEDEEYESMDQRERAVFIDCIHAAKFEAFQRSAFLAFPKLLGNCSDVSPFVKIINEYFKNKMLDKDGVCHAPSRWSCFNLDVLGNFIVLLFDYCEEAKHVAVNHSTLVLLLTAALTAYERASSHYNVLMEGTAATGKSFVLDLLSETLIERSTLPVSYSSSQVFTSSTNRELQFGIHTQHEARESEFFPDRITRSNGSISIFKEAGWSKTGVLDVRTAFVQDGKRRVDVAKVHTDGVRIIASNVNIRDNKQADSALVSRFTGLILDGGAGIAGRAPIDRMGGRSDIMKMELADYVRRRYRGVQALCCLACMALNEHLLPPVNTEMAEHLVRWFMEDNELATNTRLYARVVNLCKVLTLQHAVLLFYTHPDSPWKDRPFEYHMLGDLSLFLVCNVQTVVLAITMTRSEIQDETHRLILQVLLNEHFTAQIDDEKKMEGMEIKMEQKYQFWETDDGHGLLLEDKERYVAIGSNSQERGSRAFYHSRAEWAAKKEYLVTTIGNSLQKQNHRLTRETIRNALEIFHETMYIRKDAGAPKQLPTHIRGLDVDSLNNLVISRRLVESKGVDVVEGIKRLLNSNPLREARDYITTCTLREEPDKPLVVRILEADPEEKANAPRFKVYNPNYTSPETQRRVRGLLNVNGPLCPQFIEYDDHFDACAKRQHEAYLARYWTADRWKAFPPSFTTDAGDAATIMTGAYFAGSY